MHPDQPINESKQVSFNELLNELEVIIKEYEQVDDLAVQQALQQLRDVLINLKKPSGIQDWAATGKAILNALDWIKFFVDFIQ